MGYKKHATYFVTLLKNKLKSDAVHFTTHTFEPVLSNK